MGAPFNHPFGACLVVLCFSAAAAAGAGGVAPRLSSQVFNVKAFGAVADGKTDNSKAFLAAWRAACASEGRPRVVVPWGVFLVHPLTFAGPCKGSVVVQVRGKVRAPTDLWVFETTRADWIAFNYIDGMLITGGGSFDGQGTSAWPLNDCARNKGCRRLPLSISFNFVTNSTIRRISSINSKNFHMQIFACKNLKLRHITISAPADSPNTDGIHIGVSSDIQIRRSEIATGDDCISIGPGNRNIDISGVSCGPGHGISVGSLGGSPDDKDVVGLSVKDCNFTGTQNGVRIKTWQAPYSLVASNFTFENIVMKDVNNPIIIDQEYCPSNMCNPTSPSQVKISDVKFKNIRGTSTSKVAINLVCSKSFPCQNVELNDIDLVYSKGGEAATSSCSNVKGVSIGQVIPPSCI